MSSTKAYFLFSPSHRHCFLSPRRHCQHWISLVSGSHDPPPPPSSPVPSDRPSPEAEPPSDPSRAHTRRLHESGTAPRASTEAARGGASYIFSGHRHHHPLRYSQFVRTLQRRHHQSFHALPRAATVVCIPSTRLLSPPRVAARQNTSPAAVDTASLASQSSVQICPLPRLLAFPVFSSPIRHMFATYRGCLAPLGCILQYFIFRFDVGVCHAVLLSLMNHASGDFSSHRWSFRWCLVSAMTHTSLEFSSHI